MMLTLLMLGILVGSGFAVWRSTRSRVDVASAATLLRMTVLQARMQSIYSGVAHFVAIDTNAHSIQVFSDDGTTAGVLDSGDRQVSAARLASTVGLVMPDDPPSLGSPYGTGTLAAAWPLPAPSGGAWSGRKGMAITTTGLIETVEATPALVDDAVIVFSDGSSRTSAVGIRGRMGEIRAFEYSEGAWKER